jgi:hypothetical protein
MWQEQDRFPLSNAQVAGSPAGNVFDRPFGLRFVDYSPGRPRFNRPKTRLCLKQQIALVDGRPAIDVMPVAASMTQTESDGKDVLTVDWAVDDK